MPLDEACIFTLPLEITYVNGVSSQMIKFKTSLVCLKYFPNVKVVRVSIMHQEMNLVKCYKIIIKDSQDASYFFLVTIS